MGRVSILSSGTSLLGDLVSSTPFASCNGCDQIRGHNPFPPSLCQESFACARLLARPPSLPVPSSLLPVRHHKYAALESPFSRGVGGAFDCSLQLSGMSRALAKILPAKYSSEMAVS